MNHFTFILFSLTIALFCANPTFGQDSNTNITGTIIDAQNGSSIPYAVVVIKSSLTQEMITGTTTDPQGKFSLTTDVQNIVLEINFMGYATKTIRKVKPNNDQIDLGNIKMEPNFQELEEIAVVAEKSTVEFKLDKRVFTVGKDISSSGMGALDVLNRVPSVNVDIEGSVTLRGNAGVQILINGKPSVLADQGGNALSTITADMIESVEVITNPSAKYEAQGTAGIINIILKKDDKKGVNGSISLNTGTPNNHSLGTSINYRTERFNFFTQFGAGYRSRPNTNKSTNIDLINNTSVYSTGSGGRNEKFYNFTLGTDYHINDYNVITLSGNYAYEIENEPSSTAFDLYDGSGDLYAQYVRSESSDATNPKWQYDLQYEKQFKNNEDHVLLFSGLGRFFGKDKSAEYINVYSYGPENNPNQQTLTDYYQADYTFKLDYTNPVTEKVTIETGAQYEINDVGNDYAVFNHEGNAWLIDSTLTNNFEYNQKVLGAYATGSYEGKKWGVKAGLRAENTDLQTLLTNTNEENLQNYTNLFPSLHMSYKVDNKTSMQIGYSRRIQRPRLWDLNPFFSIQNNYNIRTGNPDLEPEYSDSYELTGIYIMKKASINASAYYLYTTNVIERVSVFQDNITVTTPINIGTRNKLGFELNGKYNPAKWFTLTGDGNFGVFTRDGEYEDKTFDFVGAQWDLEFTLTFKLPLNIDLELSPNYESGYKTVQGNVSGYAYANMGLRKKVWNGKGIFNFSVSDIFSSRIRESFVEQATFYAYSYSQRQRIITLGFSYSFGKGEAMTYSGGRRR